MNFFEKCKQCSVIVDNGSGVLFQPMTEEYSYILTAKHNLYNDEAFESYNTPKNTEDIKFICHGETQEKNILAKYEHESLDIAILKIDKLDFESPYKQIIALNNHEQCKFYGYPVNRREHTGKDKIQYFDLYIGDIEHYIYNASNQEFYQQNTINGCSGGGVFLEDSNDCYLIGIEFKMDSTRDENNSRIKFVSIQAFDEIIESNDEIEPLYPPFMNDFDLIVDDIFLLNDFEDKRDLVRDKLKYLVRKAIRDINPIDITKEFRDELFVNGHDINDISNSELWSMYLEFILLIIVLDHDSNINIDKIKEVYKKRKLLFAKTNRWVELKEDILKSNLHRLEKNGIVLIACDGDRRPNKCELNTNAILNISNPPQIEEMKIDRGVDYSKDIQYKHIYSVEKHLLDNELEFDDATNINITDKIKEVLDNVFE